MKSISQLLDDFTQYVRNCSEMLPESIENAKNHLEDCTTKYENLKEKIVTSSARGEEFLNDMKRGSPSSELPPSAINNISAVER